jgi:hypothetical protein
MGIKEDALKKEENISTTKQEKEYDSTTIHENKQKQKKHYHHSNLKQIFILSFDALRESLKINPSNAMDMN